MRLFEIIKKSQFEQIITVSFLFPLYVALKILRWWSILYVLGIKYKRKEIIKTYLSSMFLGIVTPGKIGDFAKVIYLKNDCSVSIGRGSSSVLIDRLLDLGFLLITGIVGILVFSINEDVLKIFLFLMILIFIIFILFTWEQFIIWMSLILPKQIRAKSHNFLKDFNRGFRDILTTRFLIPILISTIIFFVFYVQCYFLAIGLNIHIEFVKLCTYIAVMTIITLVPISISGIGPRDVVLIYFFSLEGLSKETAIAYSFMYLILFSIFGALIASIGWYTKPLIKLEKKQNNVQQ